MSGTKDKIEHIYSLYVDDLYTYASYMGFDNDSIMDAIHDVFYKIASLDGILNTVSDVKFYLFASLKNRLLDLRKKQTPHISLSSMDVSNETSFDIRVTIEDTLIDSEEQNRIKHQIKKMLGTLTARQREIIYLRYVQEYDYAQISQMLGITINGCRKLVSKSMQSLRLQYGEQATLLFLLLCNDKMLNF